MRISDAFTWVRIIFAPLFYLIYMIPEWTGNFVIASVVILWPFLLFAEFTDFLDGYFARKNNDISDFGKFFDPFADVVLHVTVFFCYVHSGYMPMWMLVLIVLREMSILFIRLLAQKEGFSMGAVMGGKIKTVLYVLAGFFSLTLESFFRLGFESSISISTLITVNVVFYAICVLASYASFANYVVLYFKAKNAK